MEIIGTVPLPSESEFLTKSFEIALVLKKDSPQSRYPDGYQNIFKSFTKHQLCGSDLSVEAR